MRKLLPILLAPLFFGFMLLPNQTFYADPRQNLFPAGAFSDAKKPDAKYWTDLAAFDAGDVKVQGEFLVLQNADAGKTVQVQAVLPLDPEYRWIAASAVVVARNVVLSPDAADDAAAVSLTFLDKNKQLLEPFATFSPLLKGKYTGQKARMASAAIPDNAAFVAITPRLDHVTGTLAVARIVITIPDPDKNADPEKVVALHKYIKAGNLEAVKRLVAPDKNMLESRNMDYDVGTPLIGAAWEGKADIAQFLLDAGADPLATDQNYQTTATYWAAYWGRPAVLKILLPLTKDDPKELVQAVTVGRSRNHKNTPDSDFQACLDLLNNIPTTLPAATSLP